MLEFKWELALQVLLCVQSEFLIQKLNDHDQDNKKNHHYWGHTLIVRRIRRHQLIFSRPGPFLRHLLLAKSKFSRFEKTDNTGVVHKIYIPVYQEQIPINT